MAYSQPAARPGATRASRPLPDALSLLLLLGVLAPAGVTFSRLPMWHGFTTPWPAFLAGAACCGLAALQRRAGWWVLAAVLLGAGATVLTLYVLEPGPGLALRDEQVRSRLWFWITSVRDGRAVYDDYAVDVWSTAAAWLAGMWLAWAALRAGWHWLAIGATGAVLAGTIHYLPNWPAGSLAIFAFASLLLVARLHHRALVADAVLRGIARPQRSWRAAGSQVAAIAGGAGALVFAAWALPAAHWRAPVLVRSAPRSIARPGSVAIGTANQRKVLHDFGTVLPFSGAVSLGDGVVATVDGPGPGYLFGMSYDRYSSDGWQSSASERPRQQAPLLSDAGGISHPERVGARLTDGPAYQDSLPLDETIHLKIASSVLLAAGPPVGVPSAQVSGTRGLQFAPQAIKGAPAGEYAAMLAAGGLPAGGSYTSSGLISKAAESGLRAVTAGAPDWVKSTYLQVPASEPERVKAKAAEITARATTDYDRALAIQSYLRSFPYDESISAPPPGEDGVDYLLFVARRGYCDYFASAMAIMLRSVGVPARIVVGYVMHDGTGTGPYQVHERDAHAWTEVFFAGYGWQRFDATPGGANPSPGAAGDAQSAAAVQPAIPTPAAALQDQVPPILSDSTNHALAGTPAPAGPSAALVALWASLAAFLALSCVYLWARLRGDPRTAAIAAWRSASLAGRLTTRARRPHETAHEYTAMLVREHERAAGLHDVAIAYARAEFGPGKPIQPFPRLWRRLASGISGLVTSRLTKSKHKHRTHPD